MYTTAWLLGRSISISVIYQLLVDQVALVSSSFLSVPIYDMGGSIGVHRLVKERLTIRAHGSSPRLLPRRLPKLMVSFGKDQISNCLDLMYSDHYSPSARPKKKWVKKNKF